MEHCLNLILYHSEFVCACFRDHFIYNENNNLDLLDITLFKNVVKISYNLSFDGLHLIEDILHLIDLERPSALDGLERQVVVLLLVGLHPLKANDAAVQGFYLPPHLYRHGMLQRLDFLKNRKQSL